MGIVELENSLIKVIEKGKLSLGLSLSLSDATTMIKNAYDRVNEKFPDRYVLEPEAADSFNLVDLSVIMDNKQKKRYFLARTRYIEHAECSLHRRGIADTFPEILPPYVIFPEQSGSLPHGDCTAAYEYYLNGLNDDQLLDHFHEYPLPKAYSLRIETPGLAERVQRCIDIISALK